MKLDARNLSLPEPRLVIGIEYPISEKIANRVPEVMAFGEIRELGLQEMLEVPRIGGDNTVKAAKPRTNEPKRAVLTYNNAGDPLIHVTLEAGDERRQHA